MKWASHLIPIRSKKTTGQAGQGDLGIEIRRLRRLDNNERWKNDPQITQITRIR